MCAGPVVQLVPAPRHCTFSKDAVPSKLLSTVISTAPSAPDSRILPRRRAAAARPAVGKKIGDLEFVRAPLCKAEPAAPGLRHAESDLAARVAAGAQLQAHAPGCCCGEKGSLSDIMKTIVMFVQKLNGIEGWQRARSR